MATAKTTKTLPGWEDKATAHKAKIEAGRILKDKVFEKLTDKQKEELLKQVAIRLGMIKPS